MSQSELSKQPGRQPRLTPTKRDTVDTSLIALCYWLIAQRLVEEAEAHGEFDCPEPDAHAQPDAAGSTGDPQPGQDGPSAADASAPKGARS